MGQTKTILAIIFSLIHFASVSSECTLCGVEHIPDFALSREQDGISCQSLFDEISNVEETSQDCKNIQLTAFQTGCCSETYIPEKVCSLCQDGNSFGTGRNIPNSQGRRELICSDLVTESSFLDFFTAPGDCSDTFLRRSAAWCECPGTEVECTLCPDGSSPPNPYKTENVLYEWDCANFEYVTALLSSAACPLSSQLLEFDAAAFCCPGVVPPPRVCSFCPNTHVMGDPEKLVHTEYGMLKCGDIETSLSLVPTKDSCSFAKEQFDSNLCCVNRDNAASGGFSNVRRFLRIAYIIAGVLAAL